MSFSKSEMFDWNDANLAHIAERGFDPAEAEEAVQSSTRVLLERRNVRGEHRWTYAGLTSDGRLVVVVYCRRASRIRVVTARDASRLERQKWQRSQR